MKSRRPTHQLIGEFKNPGSDYGPQGKPIEVDAHDFENKELGKVVPYGVYDVGANSGYVSLGIDPSRHRAVRKSMPPVSGSIRWAASGT